MKKRIAVILAIGVYAFLLSSVQAGESAPSAEEHCPSCSSFGLVRFREKTEAHHFSLKSLDGNTVALSDFKGKPVMLMFWATWCPSCKEELPAIEKFSADKRDKLTILMLAIDGERERKVKQVIKENKVTLPILLDVKERIARTYKINFIPAALLIDQNGMLIGKIVGERDWCAPEASSAIKEFLNLR